MKGWRVRLRRPETRGDRELPPRLRVDRPPPKRRRWISWLIPFVMLAGVPGFLWVRGFGVVEARGRIDGRVVDVGTPFDGVLASVNVSIGDVVSEGQELARIDTEPYDADVREQEALVAGAKADRERLAAEHVRTHSLAKRGFESFAVAEAARLALEAADAEVKAREAALVAAKAKRRRAVVRSPVAGMVLWEPKQPGSVVTRDTPVISVLDDRSLHVLAYVAEEKRAKIRPGQTVEFKLDGFPEQTFLGKVSYIVRGVQSRPGNLSAYDKPGETYQPVRVLPDDPDALRQIVSYGMRATVRIQLR